MPYYVHIIKTRLYIIFFYLKKSGPGTPLGQILRFEEREIESTANNERLALCLWSRKDDAISEIFAQDTRGNFQVEIKSQIHTEMVANLNFASFPPKNGCNFEFWNFPAKK